MMMASGAGQTLRMYRIYFLVTAILSRGLRVSSFVIPDPAVCSFPFGQLLLNGNILIRPKTVGCRMTPSLSSARPVRFFIFLFLVFASGLLSFFSWFREGFVVFVFSW